MHCNFEQIVFLIEREFVLNQISRFLPQHNLSSEGDVLAFRVRLLPETRQCRGYPGVPILAKRGICNRCDHQEG